METLASRIAREGPLNTMDAVGWVVRLARNIEQLHAREAVYGRITPHCVLIAGDTRTSPGWLADREQAPEALAYYSPERVAGVPASPSDDTWALAATLFEAIAGKPAFQGMTDNETRAQIIAARPTLRGPKGSLEDKLQAIFDRAFSRQWLQRTRDILTLRRELEALFPDAGLTTLLPLEELPALATTAPSRSDDDGPVIAVTESVSKDDDDATTIASRRGGSRSAKIDAPPASSHPKGYEPAPGSSRFRYYEPSPVSSPPSSHARGYQPTATSKPPVSSRAKGYEPAPVSGPPSSHAPALAPLPRASLDDDDEDRASPTTVMDPRDAPSASEPSLSGVPVSDVLPPAPPKAPAAAASEEAAKPGAAAALAAPTRGAASEHSPFQKGTAASRGGSQLALLFGAVVLVSAAVTVWALWLRRPASSLPVVETPEGKATAAPIPTGIASSAPTAADQASASPPAAAATEPALFASATASAEEAVSTAPSASAAATLSGAPLASAAPAVTPPPTELNACVLPLFASETFIGDKPPDFSFLCQETDPRRGGAALKSQVVRVSGGRISEGMREWAILSWYEMAAFAVMRARCCPSPPPLKLPPANGPCIPLDQRLNELAAATVALKINEPDTMVRQAVDEYTRAVQCAIKNGTRGTFPWKEHLQGGEDLAFLKTLARIVALK